MNDTSDHELLRRYAEDRAEEAFTELVRRHCDLVWGAARRLSGDMELARDVAQTVFSDLARKAGRLPRSTVLAGWLYRAACHAAAKHIRGEARRAQREQQAMQQHELQSTDFAEARAATELQPVLDEALADLSDADRDAVVLRFLSGRSLVEVGAALGTNEDAAQKRVSRALEKLREAFRRRGVAVSSGLVVAVLGAAGTQAAPAGLAAVVASGALAGVGTAAGTASFLLLMKSKLALGIVGGAAVATALVWQQHNVNQLAEANAALRQQVAAPPVAPPAPALAADIEELRRLRGEHAELLRLRGEVAQLRQNSTTQTAKRPPAAEPRAIQAETSDTLAAAKEARQLSQQMVTGIKYLGLAAHAFATYHAKQYPLTFAEMRGEMELAPDGTLPGGVAPDLFEFVPHNRVIGLEDLEMLLLREKSARQLPDGTWERNYCFASGAVQTASWPTNDFTVFEHRHQGTAANVSKEQ